MKSYLDIVDEGDRWEKDALLYHGFIDGWLGFHTIKLIQSSTSSTSTRTTISRSRMFHQQLATYCLLSPKSSAAYQPGP